MAKRLELISLQGIREVVEGDDLVEVLQEGLRTTDADLRDGDIVVLAQKIVSKTTGLFVVLDDIEPSARAIELAQETGKDPKLVELTLQQSTAVVRTGPNVLITKQKLGFVLANAGIDQSNVPGGGTRALLLPEDPDGWAQDYREQLAERLGVKVAVVINDSFGRPWRMGTCGTCIGAAGLTARLDLRGQTDREGQVLQVTEIAIGDEIAAAASLLMGQAAEGCPIVILRGGEDWFGEGKAADLLRPPQEDLFT